MFAEAYADKHADTLMYRNVILLHRIRYFFEFYSCLLQTAVVFHEQINMKCFVCYFCSGFIISCRCRI